MATFKRKFRLPVLGKTCKGYVNCHSYPYNKKSTEQTNSTTFLGATRDMRQDGKPPPPNLQIRKSRDLQSRSAYLKQKPPET